MGSTEKRAAEQLGIGRLRHQQIPHLAEDLRPVDLPGAYAIQDALHDLYSDNGHGEQAGYKIGCTTPVMQQYLGISHPCAGGLLANTCHDGRAELPMADFCRPGVECEIAVRLSQDLPEDDEPYDLNSVVGAVDAVAAAVEIVDDRYQDYSSFDTPTLIADDFFGAGCVLAPWISYHQELALPGLLGGMSINGQSVGTGTGADVMGHPFAALAWLANHAAARGTPLRTGSIILLGSLVATKWVEPGDMVEINVDRLGGAQVKFN